MPIISHPVTLTFKHCGKWCGIGDGDHHLLLCGWVTLFVVGFHLEHDGCMAVCGAWSVEQVWGTKKIVGLSNGTQCCLDTSSLHLVSLAKLSFPHPSSKNLKDYKSL